MRSRTIFDWATRTRTCQCDSNRVSPISSNQFCKDGDNVRITIGALLQPQHGDMKKLRDRWMEAEDLGADILWTCDHFTAQVLSEEAAEGAHTETVTSGKNFESTSIQAAMAATTSRARIGCMVHGNSFRNPNLMADIARTIDHLSDGRFILGLGSGYLKADYDEYGYDYGTATSRLHDLARNVPIIKSRLKSLNPMPLGPMPLLIGSMGDRIGLRIVAEHADMWQMYGPMEKIDHKIEVLKRHCADFQRDPEEIERLTLYLPKLLPDTDPDAYVAKGFRHIDVVVTGPDWDLTELMDLLAWKKSRGY
ncbi:LLM class F420-dependent oxidoreductase [Rhodococcus sp. NPDC057014]|uniref:LLM class F420-dependent oxidoreductase n=1 Tax=Rhodococcus sp. NPDC057014 TaxID=3346000 RepID=UPI003641DFE3